MKTVSYEFVSKEQFCNVVKEKELAKLDNNSLLIQIFSGISDKNVLEELRKVLNYHFKKAKIIGTTTDGEIIDARVTTEKIVVTFTLFEASTLTIESVNVDDSFKNGQDIANRLYKNNSRVFIFFADGMHTNGEEFLKGVESVTNGKVVVAGGLAGDNAKFEATYLITSDFVKDNVIVGVGIESNSLIVNRDYNFNWIPIGKKLKVTKSYKNRVYEIENKKTVDIFAEYLGDDIANRLPATGIEFPLIIEKDKQKIARAAVFKHSDGSVSFAGNVKEGEFVRFGIGNSELIIEKSITTFNNFANRKYEAVFIYSCMARRRFLQDMVQLELSPYKNLGSVSGFFTYGEFFSSKKHYELLNQTMTVLTLSEKVDNSNIKKIDIKPLNGNDYFLTINAMIHLINKTSDELNEINEALEDKVKQRTEELQRRLKELKKAQEHLIQSEKLASLGSIVAGVAHEINTPTGSALTGITYLKERFEKIKKLYEDDEISQEEFEEFLDKGFELCDVIYKNLYRSAELVKSFKEVAVDQIRGEDRVFELKKYIKEVILSLKNEIKRANVDISIDIDSSLKIKSNPGSFSQIFTNFIMNSIIHGFKDKAGDRRIKISAKKISGEKITNPG